MVKHTKTLAFLKKEIKPYLNQGYAFCPDTNFFMECPELLHFLKDNNEKVFISKVTYDELDSGKHVMDDVADVEKERAWKRRKGLEAMDYAQAIRVPLATNSYIQQKQLGFSNDEKIIASYLKFAEEKNEKVLYLTLDRGAKTIARSVGLPLFEFDITEFFNIKSKETPSIKSPSINKRKGIGTTLGSIGRFISILKSILILCLKGFIPGLMVIYLILIMIADHLEKKNAEDFDITGDQSQLTIELEKVGSESKKNTYEFSFSLTNNTRDKILFEGFQSEEEKKNNVQGSYGVTITYKDGSQEFDNVSSLEPREKSSATISSHGKLNEIKKIDLRYRLERDNNYKTFTIKQKEGTKLFER